MDILIGKFSMNSICCDYIIERKRNFVSAPFLVQFQNSRKFNCVKYVDEDDTLLK